ncbi:Zinc finger protein 831 [Myotis brandtii]|uniref:Zinc finger protein 831 n=1 Tax=Myotis brandtii TaxID=109478 RepID=S7NSL7_MYOBR|nr:Zinc finger protein 831 [Myotis brandtii]
MEVPELNCPASPAREQPALAPGTPGAPGQQASPHLTLGPIILPPEQSLAPTVFLKALPIPLYHTVPPGGLQPRAPLVTGGVDGGSVPFILSPLLQPEGPGPAQVGKPVTPTVTVNIVGTLPVLSPGPTLGSPGKARKAGKYLCPHCGRDCLKPSVLEKHVRSHTGERPFPCATCGIAFKTQSNLYKHRRTQTHLNNSRLSVGSDGAGGSLLEEGDKAAETPGAASSGDGGSVGGGDGARSERPLSPGVQGSGHCLVPPMHLPPIAKNLDLKAEALFCPASTLADREAPLDATHAAPVGIPLASSQRGRKPPEQKSPTAGRACSLQDTRASESRLRKCESTDSGYLSRSDSSEQPPAPGSPPHSLSDHSVESEREGASRPGGARAEPGGQEPSLELEKRQLEERIARLISHNQAVVDDPQLDHVRPRKTVLSKQGSIDLPVPYTYKDSFHFEIRALGPGRRRHGPLCPARSTCVASDRARPLLFHSVPTQLSTTVECVPVTRSHSLPFVEGTRSPFPSLRAEPRLTWCCLSGSLPLPTEQKEKATSAYWALHCPGSSAPAQAADVRPVSKAESGRRTGTSPAGGGETQPWKLSCPTAPGMTSGDPGSEPGWTKGPPRRRAKMCRGSSKQKTLRRYRGIFLQGRVRLRASRLRKPLWVLRRDCHPPPLEGLDPRRTLGQASSEMAGLSLQGESSCATSASPLGCGNREKEEKAWRPTSGGSSPSTRPRAVRDRDTWTVQDIIPSAGECGDHCPQNAAVGSGLALPPDSRMHMGDHSLLSRGKGLDPGLPETQRLPSQEPVLASPKPRAFSDAQEPLAFESKGSSPCHDAATSVAAIGTSLGTGGGHITLGAPSAEPQGPGRAAGETQTQSSPDSKALAQGLSPSLWPGKPSPGRRLSGSVPSRSPGKAHPDTPTSGLGSASSQQEEGRPEMRCLPGRQEGGAHPPGCALECGQVLAPGPPAGKDTEETPESRLVALKDGVVPSAPGQPEGAREASSKTIKKRSLGGMRKQTRVEFSDTSSDDEDRLVIEI